MDESVWLTTTTRPFDMLRHVRSLPARKLQLLACAACRLIWDRLEDPRQRDIVHTVELFAEGLIPDHSFQVAMHVAVRLITTLLPADSPQDSEMPLLPPTPQAAASFAVQGLVVSPADDGLRRTLDWATACAQRAAPQGQRGAARDRIHHQFCDLFREIVGNPFRPRSLIPAWMPPGESPYPSWMMRVSETSRCLADAIRHDQAFDRLPILADALEESGFVDEEVLFHFRHSPSPHTRGCWALDLVLQDSANAIAKSEY